MNVQQYYAWCDEILHIDSRIRFAGVYVGGNFYHRIQKGISTLLTDEETKKSLLHAVFRWKSRQDLSSKLGSPLYSITEYEKLFRMTVPHDNNSLFLVSFESDSNPFDISKKILNLIANFVWFFACFCSSCVDVSLNSKYYLVFCILLL